MEKENKELLLKDLCARLPYGVKIKVNGKIETLYGVEVLDEKIDYGSVLLSNLEEVKPYLFPLSSMNEKQKHELITLAEYESRCEESCGFDSCGHYIDIVGEYEYEDNQESIILYLNSIGIDFCNKHHLDYRGLIPMGLAIDATNLNIY